VHYEGGAMPLNTMLKDYLDKQIGFVNINKPIEYCNRSYETACWRQDSISATGVFPLILRKKDKYSSDYIVVASIPATITDDYFPSLWCGVAISNTPYVCKSVGNKCSDIKFLQDLVSAIENTGTSPGNDFDIYVNPEIWDDVIKDRKDALEAAYNMLPKYYDEYVAGDDQFQSRVGMIAHFGEMLVRYPREIQVVYRLRNYLNEKSDMWRRLHENNTSWINAK
jgi:hypothetical protein